MVHDLLRVRNVRVLCFPLLPVSDGLSLDRSSLLARACSTFVPVGPLGYVPTAANIRGQSRISLRRVCVLYKLGRP